MSSSTYNYFKRHWSTPNGYRDVLRVGFPLLASMASSTIMQFTDRLFLSRYSIDSISAALPASIASMTFSLTLFGICSYTGVLVAQYVGARAPHRVGPSIWQGLWCAIFSSILLCIICLFANPIFTWVGHEPAIRQQEIEYFIILTAGSSLQLLGVPASSFFSGRGQTKPIMLANIAAAIINIPLDYALIFGAWGFPELGIRGAGLATVIGWLLTSTVLSILVFNKKNDHLFCVLSGWKLDLDMMKRLIRFGLPSAANFFVEFVVFSWFVFEIGSLGKICLAASNIAFSINSLLFTPMLGLNMAAATLAGQAMGKKKPMQAETATWHTFHIALIYMVSMALVIVIFSEQLMDVFKTASSEALDTDFGPVKATGVVLLRYVAIYSLVDAGNLVFIGALKGIGDTIAVMRIILSCVFLTFFMPILGLKISGNIGLHSLWIVFTVYVFALAFSAFIRFRGRKWHKVRVIEQKLGPDEKA